jgi:hypothetical protein
MSAFFFVPLLAIAWILGFFVAAHASHYFLSIVESSATAMARNVPWAGRPFKEWIRDGVNWPDDLFTDYFGKTFYFADLIGIWAGPTVLLGRLLVGPSPLATVIAGAAFWLFFPIGLLSSLASESRWTPFSPGVLVAYARRPGKTLAFYLISAPVLAVLFVTFDLILLRSSAVTMTWAIVLSPLAVLLFFIYARLLGRLGMVLTFAYPAESEDEEEKAKPCRRKKKKRPKHSYDPTTRWAVPKDEIEYAPAGTQPDELPGLESPIEGPVTGYGVDYEGKLPPPEEPKPPTVIPTFDDEDNTPITVAPPPDTRGTDRPKIAAALANPPKHEVELYLRERPTEPTNPYGSESITFLFDPKTIEPWLRLTAGLISLALVQHGLDALRPE